MESHAFVGFDAYSSQSDSVDVVDGLVLSFDNHEWGDVASDAAHSADHGHFSDANKLVDADHSTDGGALFDGDVSGKGDVVGDGAVVGDCAVVPDVDKGHDVVAVTDNGFVAGSGCAVEGDVFPDEVIVTDFEECLFAFVFAILGVSAENCALVDKVSVADDCVAADGGVGSDCASASDDGFGFNDSKWSDLNILGKMGLRADNCGGVNGCQWIILGEGV